MLGTFAAAGIMKGLLALATFLVPSFANDGAYTLLYTVADGMFYFLPVVLGFTAAKKFKMSEFNGMAIAFALVYPTMVALTSGEVVGSVELGFAGTFSWYTTFLGLPLIMPASGYTSSVIPILLMVWFGSTLEHWVKKWMPASMKMFFTPLIVVTVTVTLGYLVIGPIATLITNLLGEFFALLFGLPMIGSLLGCTLVGAFWMCLVIFGFHWSLVPIALVNLSTLGHDYILGSVIAHSFSLGAVLFAMYLKNKDEKFRGIALPAMISAFFFGVTEPAIYGVALPDKKAFINASIGSAVGGLIIGLSGAVVYMSGGLGVFNWLSFIDPSGVNGINHMIWLSLPLSWVPPWALRSSLPPTSPRLPSSPNDKDSVPSRRGGAPRRFFSKGLDAMRSSERLPKIKTMPDYGAETVSADHTPFFRKLTSLLPAVLSLPFLACSRGTGSAP
mgnify:CR=1 FL=1